MTLGDGTFLFMFEETIALARRVCDGQMMVILEGGYNPAVVERLGLGVGAGDGEGAGG